MTARVRAARPEDAAPVRALLNAEALQADFVPDEFVVLEEDGVVLACARLHTFPSGAHELASVAVAPARRGERLGAQVVRAALARATGPVHALALAPGFFARLGFARRDDVPEDLAPKASGFCASTGFVSMSYLPGQEVMRTD